MRASLWSHCAEAVDKQNAVLNSLLWLADVFYNDLWRFDMVTSNWTHVSLASANLAPSPRNSLGFTITPDGTIYIFGGIGKGDGAWGEHLKIVPILEIVYRDSSILCQACP